MTDFEHMQIIFKNEEGFATYCGDGFNEIRIESKKVSFVFNGDGSLYYINNYKSNT